MEKKFKFEIHEYTFCRGSRRLKYSFHETNSAKNMIRNLAKGNFDCEKVFLVLNGVENEEEAYVFDKRKMGRVFSYHATRAVEIIACLPFYQYGNDSVMEQLAESMYVDFLNKKNEDGYPF
ncbi:MAG: hypothetical protein ACPGWR_00050 [Ardenticatenaceae bacterium]